MEQILVVINLIGYSSLFMTFTSICFLFYGEYLINKYKLESRLTNYPILLKLLKIRQKLVKPSFIYYIVVFYITIIVFIGINIYIFMT